MSFEQSRVVLVLCNFSDHKCRHGNVYAARCNAYKDSIPITQNTRTAFFGDLKKRKKKSSALCFFMLIGNHQINCPVSLIKGL